jgi:hypothetical protein
MKSLAISTVLLALVWFTIVNLTASLFSWGAALIALRRRGSRHRAGVLLAVRLLPAGASFLIALVLFVPAHWLTEPRDARETFGWALWATAALGAALIVRGVLRAAALARADRRLRSRERGSDVLPDVREAEGVPGIALAGLVRTRIVMGDQVAASLTAAELDVALAHECAHRGAVDNLKRWAIYCAPDFFGATAIAKTTERAWHGAAESLADARAVRGDAQRAVDLASALVKVARLGAERPRLDSAAWSTFNDPALLEHRVQLLTGGAPVAARSRPLRAAAAALALIAVAAMLVPVLSGTIHTLTEAAVAFLP